MSMTSGAKPIKSVLIVGGGTAGWLTATILASRYYREDGQGLAIRLVEAPDIPTIGVGEGTWPSMRSTLRNAGIEEADFLRECNASYKQASKFVGWRNGQAGDFYYHPFDLPQDFLKTNLAQHWLDYELPKSFASTSCVQEILCENHLSPKLVSTPGYAGASNYGYHLNAGKFSLFLRKHCTEKLGVELVLDRVTSVNAHENGDITSVQTEASGALEADLFVDCTGFRSLLLGEHFGVNFLDKSHVLPINSALAVQAPYSQGDPVKSPTISTAQEAGWIWDIGLSTRRGVGHVYSDSHISHDDAYARLQNYLGIDDAQMEALSPRRLAIRPGYRAEFWKQNCVAIGLSGGFLEPLEASAIMLIEGAANLLADIMPVTRGAMDMAGKRFNRRFHYRWERIIDFLKLHYALSQRKEAFWKDSSDRATLSERLKDDLELWGYQAPWKNEYDSLDEVFPAASYQYVLYGMGFKTHKQPHAASEEERRFAEAAIETVRRNAGALSSRLETNRKMLDLVNA